MTLLSAARGVGLATAGLTLLFLALDLTANRDLFLYPDLALGALVKLVEAGADVDVLWELLSGSAATRARLTSLLGASVALGEHLAVHPAHVEALRTPPPATPAAVDAQARAMGRRIVEAVGADPDDPVRGSAGRAATGSGPDVVEALRVAYRRELATVAAWDLAAEIGVVVPPVRTRDNLELPARTYAIKLFDIEVARGEASQAAEQGRASVEAEPGLDLLAGRR